MVCQELATVPQQTREFFFAAISKFFFAAISNNVQNHYSLHVCSTHNSVYVHLIYSDRN